MTRTNKHAEILQPEQPWESKFRAPFPKRVKAVLGKGCKPIPLKQFLIVAANPDWYDERRNGEIGTLKTALSNPASRLEEIADDLDKLADNPLWFASADVQEGKNLATVEFLRFGAGDLRAYAAGLKKRSADIGESWSSRRTNYLVPLCLYCKAASRSKVTIREIANLLDWAGAANCDEHAIETLLSRHRKQPYSAVLSERIEQYVAECPDGGQSFGAWSRQQRNRALETGEQTCTA
jgi:hypothetical protein